MDRGRERRFDEPEAGYHGRSFRNDRGGFRGGRLSPRGGGYRGGRSPHRRSPPPRRGRTPPPYDNGYSATGPRPDDRARSRSQRRRSRSPVRDREDGYGQRQRPRSPYREDRRRSPPPYAQGPPSPYGGAARDGSPPPARGRDRSPPAGGYRQYSPPPKHGRYANNGDEEFDRRDGPPPRDDSRRYTRDNYRSRGRSRSPYRVSAHASRGETPNSSHRSSPRSYGERMRIDKPSPGYGPPRHDQAGDKPSPRYPPRERSQGRRAYSPRPRSPPPRDHSPPPRSPPRRGLSPPPRSPADEQGWSRNRGPPLDRDGAPRERNDQYQERNYQNRERLPYQGGQASRSWRKPASPEPSYPQPVDDRSPPPAASDYPPESYRESGPRPQSPTGGTTGHRAPFPHGPSHPRGGRGGPGYSREPREPREPGYGGREESFRGRDESYRGRGEGYRGRDESYRGRGRGYGGAPRGGYDSRPSPGPRGGSYSANYPPASPPRGSGGDGNGGGSGWTEAPGNRHAGPPFRSNNSTSTTYPRTQHFNTAKGPLGSLAQVVEGGRKAPSALEPAQEKRLAQLEEDRKKLLETIEEKERAKRQGLREWNDLERESKREGLKAELAEGHLEKLSGETSAGGAY